MERRRELLARYRDELERIDEELAEHDPEVVESSTEQWDASVLSSLGDADARALDAVVKALDRLASGTYGRCITCDRPITLARLDALPETALCIECASAGERPRARTTANLSSPR